MDEGEWKKIVSGGLVCCGQSMPVRPTNKMLETKNNFMCSGICVRRAFNCFIALECMQIVPIHRALWYGISGSIPHIPPIEFHFHTNDTVKIHRNEIPFVSCFFYDFPHTQNLHTVFCCLYAIVIVWRTSPATISRARPYEMVEIWNLELCYSFFGNKKYF